MTAVRQINRVLCMTAVRQINTVLCMTAVRQIARNKMPINYIDI